MREAATVAALDPADENATGGSGDGAIQRIQHVKRRRLGHTDVAVSVIALGTAALGLRYGIDGAQPPPSETDAVELVREALAHGINFIDTARAYGSSEEIIGRATAHQPAVIATKAVCSGPDGRLLRGDRLRDQVRSSLETSLRVLGRDSVQLFMAHSAPLELLRAGEILPLLHELRDEGLTGGIGISTYSDEAALYAIDEGVDALQIAYSVFDQRMAARVMPKAQEYDVAVIARSVFLKGALTEQGEDLPRELSRLKDASRAFRQQAHELGLHPAAAALRFVLSRTDVTAALLGVRRFGELHEALTAAADGPLSSDHWEALARHGLDDPTLVDPSLWGRS